MLCIQSHMTQNGSMSIVLNPRETRPALVLALEMAATKKGARLCTKHGAMPV